MMLKSLRSASLLLVACAFPVAAQTSGREVFQRMHDAYAGKWYSTLRFVQKTTQIRDNGDRIISTWYESLRYTPAGRTELRIDFGDPTAGNATLYTADSSWSIRGGKVAATRGEGNEFLPLIEGVYLQPVEKTIAQIAPAKVDMSRVAKGSWQGRPATIIGVASATDSTKSQIWVDDERNVVVRMLMSPTASMPAMDIHLHDYVKVGNGWLATRIVMSRGGKPVQIEDYADWKVGIDLPAGLFDVNAWNARGHWATR